MAYILNILLYTVGEPPKSPNAPGGQRLTFDCVADFVEGLRSKLNNIDGRFVHTQYIFLQ